MAGRDPHASSMPSNASHRVLSQRGGHDDKIMGRPSLPPQQRSVASQSSPSRNPTPPATGDDWSVSASTHKSMSLRKTYSEQRPWNNRNKPWQRSRSYGPRPPPFDPPLPRPPPPPVVISTATKNKLQTFQFQPPPPEEDVFVDADVDRANREDTAAGGATRKTAETTPPRMASPPSRPVLQPVSNDSSSSTTTNKMDAEADSAADKENKEENKENHNGALPSTQPNKVAPPVVATPEFLSIHVGTPRARFAWQDLAGTPDTPRVTESLGMSPNAQLSWMPEGETARMPSPAAGAPPTRPGGGGVKRALSSSSPPSSPSHSSRSKAAARNVQKFKDALKNALANPVAPVAAGRTRLARHHTAVGGNTAAGAAAAAAEAEAKAISPDGPLSRGPSPFRRTVSCVDALPTTKRRRLDAPAETPTRVRPLPAAAVSPAPERADLVMADAVPRPQHTHQLSPVPASGSRRALPNPSPPPAALERLSLHVNDEAHATCDTTHALGRPPPPADETDSTSDYGDDFFDDDVLAELDASTAPPAVLAQLPNPTTPGARKKEPPRATTTTSSSQDEFGEFDDDVFEAAEDMMTQINSGCPPATAAKDSAQQETAGAAVPQRQAAAAPHVDSSDADDAYGDDFGDDFDFDAVEKAATQAAGTTATGHPTPWTSLPDSSQKPRAIQRYLVKNVIPSAYIDERKRTSNEKVLSVQAEGSRAMRTVHLRGDWVDTPVSVKAFVHVLGDFDAAGRCVVDNDHNMLILHPDQLVSSTVVADSFSCTRRAVLQDRVKATSEPGPPLVYGTLLHEIFQQALTANQWSTAFLDAVVEGVIQKHLEDLYTIKVEPGTAREHLQTRMRELQAWARLFVAPQPRPGAVVLGRNGEKVRMAVRKLLDVEEHVWSPMYGLKGNIDATVEVAMEEAAAGGQQQPRVQTLTVPFELKTGRNASSSHQAQTVLYNLLLSDRYDIEIVSGVLYYMENSQMLRIPTVRHELRHMIMKRNELACYVRERSVQLPPMLRSQGQCGRCFAQTPCFLYHKLADGGDGATSGMGAAFDDVTGHLTARHRAFFLKWEDLLTKEERESQKLRRELWTMVSSEREKLGRCFADVVIEPGSAVPGDDGAATGTAATAAASAAASAKINRFQYTLVKQNPPAGFSFQDSELAVGEPIVISDEAGHFALALGYVTAVRRQRITVAVDRRLHNARIRQAGFDAKTNQAFSSMMDTTAAAAAPRKGNDDDEPEPVVRYRLDKDEFSNGMALVRNNLVQIMAAGQLGSRKIRELVVDLVAPRFRAASSAPTTTTTATTPTAATAPTETLNVDQRRAIDKVMSAQDYALVLGMPGTGKTTTIAHIIRALIRKGKSVLLASYTHTAVDNILLKLRTADMPPILRLGALAKVHPEVREFCVLASEPKTSFEAIRAAWHAPPVVATTCLGIQHPLFHERVFDYCIVDEASQITLPICLGPIRMADRFVLVGDHNQLPPIVQNEAARAGGLDVSLFKLLSDTHPASVVNLEHQYRMCEDVMTLSNTLIYRGRLKCGTEALRTRSLAVPDLERLAQHHYGPGENGAGFCASGGDTTTTGAAPCWLRDLVAPARRVAFVNTDAIAGSREESKGNRIVNVCEARVVAQLVEAFLTVGVPAAEVGVMTHYRSQLALLKQQLRGVTAAVAGGLGHGGGRHIEMHTTDRFQGRDKEVIVLSLVRNNEACNIGDLLKDWRRINVAFTRAKTKLLVVGSRSTLKGMAAAVEAAATQPGPGTPDTAAAMDDINGEEMLGRFIRLMEERHWVYDLPADALDSHVFAAFPATQAGSSLPGPGPERVPEPGPSLPASASASASAAPAAPVTQASPPKRVPLGSVPDRANRQPLKRARAGPEALLKGKPVLRDILNSMMGGAYS